jgi:polyisoprenoid-binding protein YceI
LDPNIPDRKELQMAVATQPFTGAFVADRNHSSVLFSVRHMKVSRFRASFADVDARLAADEEDVRLEGRARVDSISIAEPPELREHVVSGKDFFDAAEHPEIRFRSSRVDFGDDGAIRVAGELELRGLARPIEASGTYRPPVVDPYGMSRGAIELVATIDRRAWGLNWQMPLPDGDDVLGWEVELDVRLELVQD